MKYYLIVGEASGDLHASHLMSALKTADPQADFRNTKVSENSDMAKSWATFCCSGTYK